MVGEDSQPKVNEARGLSPQTTNKACCFAKISFSENENVSGSAFLKFMVVFGLIFLRM